LRHHDDCRRHREANKDGHCSEKFHYCLSPDMSRSFSAAVLCFLHVLVALLPAPDLLLFAKHLSVEAIMREARFAPKQTPVISTKPVTINAVTEK
jgi:hypothetical protein